MCRLLGVVAHTASPLAKLLDQHADPFRELSREHCDGWGAAHWHDGDLAVVKDTAPAVDSAEFTAMTEHSTDAAVLHIRLASPAMAVLEHNTHPFTAEGVAFAHNGHFTPPDAVSGLAGTPVGDTDSERYFLRVLALLRTGEPPAAIAQAAAEIAGVCEYSSLNCLLLTENALYAYAHHDPASEVSRRRGPGFFDLRYQVNADQVTVASTGWPQDGWQVLPQRHVLEVGRSSLQTVVHDLSS